MNISMKTDIKAGTKKLRGAKKKQIPFATASALTSTAWDVSKEEKRQLTIKLDRPTGFTKKAFGVKKATKTHQVATVYIKPLQAKYLGFQVKGGTRLPAGASIAVPVNVRTNRYGNMPRYQVAALLNDPDVFSGNINGHAGLWRRSDDGSVTMLVAWEPKAKYRPRFPFHKIGKGKAKAVMGKNLRIAIDKALRTAR